MSLHQVSRISVTVMIFLFAGCGFTEYKTGGSTQPVQVPAQSGETTPTPVATSPVVTSSATFTAVNSQILQPKCLGCHGAGSSPDFSSYGTFAANTSFIMPGKPTSSAVYNAVQSGSMPQGSSALPAADVTLIYDWIQAGALNN